MDTNERLILLALRNNQDNGLLHFITRSLSNLKQHGYIDYRLDMQGDLIDGTVKITPLGRKVQL